MKPPEALRGQDRAIERLEDDYVAGRIDAEELGRLAEIVLRGGWDHMFRSPFPEPEVEETFG